MRPALLAALAALLVAGCDSDSESLLGEFRATIALDGTVQPTEGEAVWSVVETADGPRFVLGLFVGDLYESDVDDYDFALLHRVGGRPGVGAYAVDTDTEGGDVAASYARVLDADEPLEASGTVLRGTDGTLALTRYDTNGFLSGSFQFDADGIRVEDPSRRVAGRLSGLFEARYVDPATLRSLGVDLGL